MFYHFQKQYDLKDVEIDDVRTDDTGDSRKIIRHGSKIHHRNKVVPSSLVESARISTVLIH